MGTLYTIQPKSATKWSALEPHTQPKIPAKCVGSRTTHSADEAGEMSMLYTFPAEESSEMGRLQNLTLS